MRFNIPCYKKRNAATQTASITTHPPIQSDPNVGWSRLADSSIVYRADTATATAALSAAEQIPQCTVLGEEKQLALMFLDIRNFTAFMEQRSPYDVIYVIRKLFVLFNDSIREAGGRIIETVGDSIYAVFGMDKPIEDAVKAAMNASMAIFHDLEVFNTTYAKPYFDLDFEIGVGLHQGQVLVGEYDMDQSERLTVMGLPVNIAARLQSETKELNNDLLVSEDMYRLLNDRKEEAESRMVYLKGITEPLKVRLMGNAYQKRKIPTDALDYYIAMAG